MKEIIIKALLIFLIKQPLLGNSHESVQNYWEELREDFSSNKDNRLNFDSGWVYVNDSDVELYSTINKWDIHKNKRVRRREISKKAFDMIKKAEKIIIASVFLFDNMYSENPTSYDLVDEFTRLLINKKRYTPDIRIIIILDPLNRAYSRRVSPAVKAFNENGIDVFYSDLLPTDTASKIYVPEALNHLGRFFNELSLGSIGGFTDWITSFPILPGDLDGQRFSIEMMKEAALLKANHRKILVTDTGQLENFEALVSSANPHNASDDSSNDALSVKGELAKTIYMVVREDAIHSLLKYYQRPLNLGEKKPFAMISGETLEKYNLKPYREAGIKKYLKNHIPPININSKNDSEGSVKAKFVTENKIKINILDLLEKSSPSDEIRIQMFYLSDFDVVNSILKVAENPERKESNPVRIILDPNKDAFNSIKDGTPNRQVAYHFLTNIRSKNKILVRWYSTHGEQMHSKIMTITNNKTGKYQIITGSCNWTGKNMKNINMESNLIIDGSQRINEKYNSFFDKAWTNSENGFEYTLDYDSYDLKTTHEMIIGHKIVKTWSKEYKANWLNKNRERLYQLFLRENPNIVLDYGINKIDNWLIDKIQNDKTGVMKGVLTLVGEDNYPDQDFDYKKWVESYMKKWHFGENWGLVSW